MNDKIIYSEKKNQEKKSIIVVVSILLIILIIVIGFLISNSNKSIIKRSLSQIEKKTNYYAKIVNENTLNKDKYKLEGTITPDVKIDSQDTLNTGFNVDKLNDTSINYVVNQNNKDLSVSYDVLINNESKGIVEAILKDEITYLNLGDSWSEVNQENMMNKEDLEYLKSVILKSLSNNIDSDLYSSEKEAITIDGEEINAKKVSVTLKDNDLCKVVNQLVKDLNEDKKASNILEDNNIDLKDVKFNKEDFEGFEVVYSTYKKSTYGKYVAFNLSLSDDNNEINITYKSDENDELEINTNDLKMIVNVQKEDDSFTAKLNVNDQEVATLEYSIEELKENLSLSIYFDLYNIDMSVANEYKKQGNNYNLNGNANVLVKYDNHSVLDISLENKGTLTNKVDDIEKPKNADESFDITSLTDFLNPIMNEYLVD